MPIEVSIFFNLASSVNHFLLVHGLFLGMQYGVFLQCFFAHLVHENSLEKNHTIHCIFVHMFFFLVGKILPWKRHSIGFVAMDMVSIVHRCRHLKLNLFTVQKNDMCKPTKICIHQNRKVPFPQKMLKICVNLIYFHFKKKRYL